MGNILVNGVEKTIEIVMKKAIIKEKIHKNRPRVITQQLLDLERMKRRMH